MAGTYSLTADDKQGATVSPNNAGTGAREYNCIARALPVM